MAALNASIAEIAITEEVIRLNDSYTGTIYKAISQGDFVYFGGENNGISTLSKYNIQGNLVWQKTYDYGFDDGRHSVTITKDNELIFAASPTNGSSVIHKLDLDGNLAWTKESYGSVFDIEEDNDVIYISGGTGNLNSFDPSRNGFISAFNASNGDQLWSKQYPDSTASHFADIEISDNSIYVVGSHYGKRDYDWGVAGKVALNGDQVWWSKADNEGWNNFQNGEIIDDQLIVTGMTTGEDRQDARAVSFNLDTGNQNWNESWGDDNVQFPETIASVGDKIFLSYMDGVPWGYSAGTTQFDQGFTRIVEINEQGEILNTKSYDIKSQGELPRDLFTVNDSLYLIGQTYSGELKYETYIAKVYESENNPDVDLVFTTSLTKADGQDVDGFKVAAHGSQAEQSVKYILNVEVTNYSGESLEGVDFTLNFADPLFKEIFDNHVSITENLDLANSVAIDADGGGVRVMAGSAGNLTAGASGIDDGSKSTVASFLLDIDDSQFVNGLDGLDTAGIQITANLDQTVFGDLTTLRDRGGLDAYSIGSEDISVVMAEAQLDDVTTVNTQMGQDQDGFVLGSVRETGVYAGVNDFSNLIRSGATVYDASSTWTNHGDISATDVELSLNSDSINLDDNSIDLKINSVGFPAAAESDVIRLDNVGIGDSITIDYAIKASAAAGSVFNSADIGYELNVAGEKSFTSITGYKKTTNLITYQGDLNLDGTVSMLDLAYLNSGADNGALDTDANFDGEIDMLDLEFIDSDWGESLHTGDQTFTGNNSMSWSELSSSESGAAWSDTSFQEQNAIESGDDFQVLLDLDDMGAAELDIESEYFQNNDLDAVEIR